MFPLISTEGLLSQLSFDLNIIRFIKMICLVLLFVVLSQTWDIILVGNEQNPKPKEMAI